MAARKTVGDVQLNDVAYTTKRNAASLNLDKINSPTWIIRVGLLTKEQDIMVRKPLDLFSFIHFVGLSTVGLAVLYVFNNFLMISFDAPGILNTLGIGEEMGVVTPSPATSKHGILGYAQTIMPIFIIVLLSACNNNRGHS